METPSELAPVLADDPCASGWGRRGGGASDWVSQPGFKAKAATGFLRDFEQSLLSPASVSELQMGDLGEGVEEEVGLAGTPWES